MVIGGTLDEGDNNLDPVIININEEGLVNIEKCGNRKGFEKMEIPEGQFFGQNLVICGYAGYGCFVIDSAEVKKFPLLDNNRIDKAMIKLNDSTFWVTGGGTNNFETEFITETGSAFGPWLPLVDHGINGIEKHCMVLFEPNRIFMIGGTFRKKYLFKATYKTWIIDIANNFTAKEGPRLKKGRNFPNCGKMRDEFGNTIVVVVGGNDKNMRFTDSVEFINATLMDKWAYGDSISFHVILLYDIYCNTLFFSSGPKLPYKIGYSALVSSSEKKGILLVGGKKCKSSNCFSSQYLEVILSMTNLTSGWKEITITSSEKLRKDHLALEIDDSQRKSICGKS